MHILVEANWDSTIPIEFPPAFNIKRPFPARYNMFSTIYIHWPFSAIFKSLCDQQIFYGGGIGSPFPERVRTYM